MIRVAVLIFSSPVLPQLHPLPKLPTQEARQSLSQDSCSLLRKPHTWYTQWLCGGGGWGGCDVQQDERMRFEIRSGHRAE